MLIFSCENNGHVTMEEDKTSGELSSPTNVNLRREKSSLNARDAFSLISVLRPQSKAGSSAYDLLQKFGLEAERLGYFCT